MKSSKVTHHPGYVGTVFSTVEDELETHTTDIAALEAAGFVVGPASATDLAAARFDLTTGKLVQDSVLVIADTTGSLSRTGGGGIPVQGTNTNDSPTAGYVGECIIGTGSAVSLSTGSPVNITSISLTAGDWDVSAFLHCGGGGAVTTTNIVASISSTSATQDTTIGKQVNYRFGGGAGTVDAIFSTAIPPYQIKLTATTTIYLVATVTFTSSQTANGRLHARRMR
jgi:hypothetical protein